MPRWLATTRGIKRGVEAKGASQKLSLCLPLTSAMQFLHIIAAFAVSAVAVASPLSARDAKAALAALNGGIATLNSQVESIGPKSTLADLLKVGTDSSIVQNQLKTTTDSFTGTFSPADCTSLYNSATGLSGAKAKTETSLKDIQAKAADIIKIGGQVIKSTIADSILSFQKNTNGLKDAAAKTCPNIADKLNADSKELNPIFDAARAAFA
ncbi:hypothetical protein MIND_01344400 [Mycena indigotica]|uniref:Uncharacterized protein n=1 Tax=Mycena indigotica TaxID=2126181 RepID=A0A8H6VTP4_9AGAR|nr:uncharacterized protein MIND_01344400 [Mycena indigotica]KAF7289713.1 hypothetical protein MIND_01344400 [Mycena indigotica]